MTFVAAGALLGVEERTKGFPSRPRAALVDDSPFEEEAGSDDLPSELGDDFPYGLLLEEERGFLSGAGGTSLDGASFVEEEEFTGFPPEVGGVLTDDVPYIVAPSKTILRLLISSHLL